MDIKAWHGIRNDVSPERTSPGDMVAGVNVLLRDDNRIQRRMGALLRQTAGVGQTLHSLWSDGDQIGLCVQGSNLCHIHPTTHVLTEVAALDARSPPMAYTSLDGAVYFSNGTDTGVYQQGRVRTWGLEAPACPAASVVPGSMPAGLYHWTLTYVRNDGQQSGAIETRSAQLAQSSGLRWTLPVSTDPTVTHKALWLSTADGEVMYRAAIVANAEIEAVYAGDTTELTDPMQTMWLAPAPPGQCIGVFRGRLWVADDAVLYPSQPFSPELFDRRENLQHQGRVTMLATRPDDQALLVGSTAGVGWMIGSTPADMRYEHALDDPVLPGSLVWVPGDRFGKGHDKDVPMWTGQSGVYAATPPYWTVQAVTLDRVRQDLRGRVAAIFDKARGQYLATVST